MSSFRSKVIIRNLPADTTEAKLMQLLTPWLDKDDINYVTFHPGRVPNRLAGRQPRKAYALVNFTTPSALLDFVQPDAHVLQDARGQEHALSIEFAPYQVIPLIENVQGNPSTNTLETDEEFRKFVDELSAATEATAAVTSGTVLDEQVEVMLAKERALHPWKYAKGTEGSSPTPLLQYLMDELSTSMERWGSKGEREKSSRSANDGSKKERKKKNKKNSKKKKEASDIFAQATGKATQSNSHKKYTRKVESKEQQHLPKEEESLKIISYKILPKPSARKQDNINVDDNSQAVGPRSEMTSLPNPSPGEMIVHSAVKKDDEAVAVKENLTENTRPNRRAPKIKMTLSAPVVKSERESRSVVTIEKAAAETAETLASSKVTYSTKSKQQTKPAEKQSSSTNQYMGGAAASSQAPPSATIFKEVTLSQSSPTKTVTYRTTSKPTGDRFNQERN